MLEEWRWFELSCSKSVRLLLYLFSTSLPTSVFFSPIPQWFKTSHNYVCTCEFVSLEKKQSWIFFFEKLQGKRTFFYFTKTLSIKYNQNKRENSTMNLADLRVTFLLLTTCAVNQFFSYKKFRCVKEEENFFFFKYLRKYLLRASLSFCSYCCCTL